MFGTFSSLHWRCGDSWFHEFLGSLVSSVVVCCLSISAAHLIVVYAFGSSLAVTSEFFVWLISAKRYGKFPISPFRNELVKPQTKMAIQKVTAVFNLNQMLATDDVEALIAELDNPRSKLNPYKRDTNGYSLAMTAAKSGAFSIVKYLVEVYKLGLKSSTTNALVLATETDNLKLFKYLTRHLRIGDTDDSGYNAWERALINNAEKCCNWAMREYPSVVRETLQKPSFLFVLQHYPGDILDQFMEQVRYTEKLLLLSIRSAAVGALLN